MGNRCVVI